MSSISQERPDGSNLVQGLAPLLKAWIPSQRWFRSKSRAIERAALEAWAPLDDSGCVFAAARVEFADGAFERYALPLALKDEAEAEGLPDSARVGRVETSDGTRVWCDGSREPSFHKALFALLAGRETLPWAGGTLSGSPVPSPSLESYPVEETSAKLLSAEQSNTSLAYSSGHFAKLYRRLEEAVNPEPETLRFLGEAGYPHVPAFASSLEWRVEGREPVTIGLLQSWVSSRGDAWSYALEQLQRAAANGGSELPPALSEWAATLGRRVAELHNALGSGTGAFAPEPLLPEDLTRLRSGTGASLSSALAALESVMPALAPSTAALARAVLEARERFEARLARLEAGADASGAMKTRTHGDLHLGQILVSTDDPERVWILDFEGEPGRPLAEARRKHSPVRDAAGMMRSFHYAAHVAMREPSLRPKAERFSAELARRFREAYFEDLRVPSSSNPRALLEAFMLEKAVYELHYELNNRPDWAEIPLLGLQQLVTEYP